MACFLFTSARFLHDSNAFFFILHGINIEKKKDVYVEDVGLSGSMK